MSKDGKCNITQVIETTFGPVMMPISECMYCFAARKFNACSSCQFLNELQKAGLDYVNEKTKILNEG